MKLQQIQEQWWYRLLKVVYYSLYVISCIIGIIVFPLVIIFFEFIRGAFFYVAIGDWNWQFERKKKVFKKLLGYIQKDGSNGLSRLAYNLILVLIVLPGFFLSLSLLLSDFQDAIIGGVIVSIITFFTFLIISFYRFHNIGISGKNIWWLIFPIMNIIYLGKLVFQKEGIKKEKYKKESATMTLILFILIIGGIIGFYVYQFYSLQNTVDSMKDSQFEDGPYTKEELIIKIREVYPQYNEVDEDKLYNGFLEKYPEYSTQIISQ